jgi:hypothetical protein
MGKCCQKIDTEVYSCRGLAANMSHRARSIHNPPEAKCERERDPPAFCVVIRFPSLLFPPTVLRPRPTIPCIYSQICQPIFTIKNHRKDKAHAVSYTIHLDFSTLGTTWIFALQSRVSQWTQSTTKFFR